MTNTQALAVGTRVRRIGGLGTRGTVYSADGATALVQWDGHDSRQSFAITELEIV